MTKLLPYLIEFISADRNVLCVIPLENYSSVRNFKSRVRALWKTHTQNMAEFRVLDGRKSVAKKSIRRARDADYLIGLLLPLITVEEEEVAPIPAPAEAEQVTLPHLNADFLPLSPYQSVEIAPGPDQDGYKLTLVGCAYNSPHILNYYQVHDALGQIVLITLRQPQTLNNSKVFLGGETLGPALRVRDGLGSDFMKSEKDDTSIFWVLLGELITLYLARGRELPSVSELYKRAIEDFMTVETHTFGSPTETAFPETIEEDLRVAAVVNTYIASVVNAFAG